MSRATLEQIELLIDSRRGDYEVLYPNGVRRRFEAITAPFSLCYLINGFGPGGGDDRKHLVEMIGRMIRAMTVEPAGKTIASDTNNKRLDILGNVDEKTGRRLCFASYGLRYGTAGAPGELEGQVSNRAQRWICESLSRMAVVDGALSDSMEREIRAYLEKNLRFDAQVSRLNEAPLVNYAHKRPAPDADAMDELRKAVDTHLVEEIKALKSAVERNIGNTNDRRGVSDKLCRLAQQASRSVSPNAVSDPALMKEYSVFSLSDRFLRHWRARRVPSSAAGSTRDVPKEKLDAAVRSLMRWLRPVSPTPFRFTPGGHALTDVYLIVDLGDPACVKTAMEVARIVRQESVQIQITAILLTGRTAEYGGDDEDRWKEGLREIVLAHQVRNGNSECLLHCAYLLDGKNARQSWVQTLKDHTRMAAEFLLHHGLSAYRQKLRKHERPRISAGEPLSNVLGSFACRIVHSDRETISRAVAAELIDQGVLRGVSRPLLPKDEENLQQYAYGLGSELQAILEQNPPSSRLRQPAADVSGRGRKDWPPSASKGTGPVGGDLKESLGEASPTYLASLALARQSQPRWTICRIGWRAS